MSEPSWFNQTPPFVKIAMIPVFGGGAIASAGYEIRKKSWVGIGIGFVLMSAIAFLVPVKYKTPLLGALYLGQIATAISFRQEYLIKTYPRHLSLPDDARLFQLVAASRPKIDINICSKDDLVNRLGLAIVYANDLMSLREEGYIFTYPEELTEILGIPAATVQKVSPFIMFTYYQTPNYGWQQVNRLGVEDLVSLGLELKTAMVIAQERELNGDYKSLIDIKNRTGIPFSAYQYLS